MGKRRKTRKPNIIVKYCVVCGAKIYVNRSTAKYCSDACRMQAYLESKKLQKADAGVLKEDRSVLISNRQESEFFGEKKAYHDEPATYNEAVKGVPTDSEDDFKMLKKELKKILEGKYPGTLWDNFSIEESIRQRIAKYKKRFNTTIESSKARYPNVNFKFSDPG